MLLSDVTWTYDPPLRLYSPPGLPLPSFILSVALMLQPLEDLMLQNPSSDANLSNITQINLVICYCYIVFLFSLIILDIPPTHYIYLAKPSFENEGINTLKMIILPKLI